MQKVVDIITIEKLEGGAFTVRYEEKYADAITYDEMLGLVSALTMPESRPCLQWMRTKEGHEISSPKYGSPSEVEFEDILVPESIGIYRYGGYSMDDDGDTLLIGFNNSQLLGYCNGHWNVSTDSDDNYEKVQCKLIPCNREDLKVGDTAFANLQNDYNNPLSYCKILNDKEVAHIATKGSVKVTAWSESSLQWHKVVPA